MKAIIVQRRLRNERSSLDDLRSLAESAGYTIVCSLEQIRKPDSRYQIGSGKARELAELVTKHEIKKAIFDNELRPVQAYNLAKTTGVEAIDRFQLILEIFALRASTVEAKLQIELARLRYELSRAKERVKLAKMEEQPGFMGLGMYEVDLYYEEVKRRISSIREKLKKERRRRSLHRARRLKLGFTSVALAGYTNAGKSSLFNVLAEEIVPVDSELFTTLSTTTRIVALSGKKILLTDTVGFIDRLPLTLIEAFHSTLEETIFSNLILLVVDVSEPRENIERKLSCCLETIEKIDASRIPLVMVFNKIDLLADGEIQSKIEPFENLASGGVPISAVYKTNIHLLKQKIFDRLASFICASFSVPLSDESMSFLSWLFGHTGVRSVKYKEDKVDVVFESIPLFANKVKMRVEQLGGTFNS
ncbi:MAG: GTPase HflX [Candidatus Bathyarchaeota archaeon]|nr:GTPase HflX [Candidatus Bathyarchaeota archaeon]